MSVIIRTWRYSKFIITKVRTLTDTLIHNNYLTKPAMHDYIFSPNDWFLAIIILALLLPFLLL